MATSAAPASMTLTRGGGGDAPWVELASVLVQAAASEASAAAMPIHNRYRPFFMATPSLQAFAQAVLVVALEIGEQLLRAHAARDELHVRTEHLEENAHPALVDEGHVVEIDDAPSPASRIARVCPARPQLGDARLGQSSLQDPSLLRGGFSDRD